MANEFLCWMRDAEGRKPGSVYNYASVIARFLTDCVGARPLDAVPVDDVQDWLMEAGRPCARHVAAPATRARNG